MLISLVSGKPNNSFNVFYLALDLVFTDILNINNQKSDSS
jgi:hypothetical protein